MFVAATELPVSPGHPFYAKVNTILDGAGFDRFAEEQCQRFSAPVNGRPSLPPGRYFRLPRPRHRGARPLDDFAHAAVD
jgi:transposase